MDNSVLYIAENLTIVQWSKMLQLIYKVKSKLQKHWTYLQVCYLCTLYLFLQSTFTISIVISTYIGKVHSLSEQFNAQT